MERMIEKRFAVVVFLLFFAAAEVSGEDYDEDYGEDDDSMGKCSAPPVSISCDEPRTQYMSMGISGSAPLFSDAKMKTVCKKQMSNMFKTKTSQKAQRPYSGMFKCASQNEAMTGFEICFQMDLVYIAPYCTELEDGYKLDMDNVKRTFNSPEKPEEAICPDEMAAITLQLEKNDDTKKVTVSMDCAKIVKK